MLFCSFILDFGSNFLSCFPYFKVEQPILNFCYFELNFAGLTNVDCLFFFLYLDEFLGVSGKYLGKFLLQQMLSVVY